ncbi:MAG: hypothetical protein FWD23_02785 [Oscillospiraceae bacterium]|nr:hypothetical protein [Oscillospiraceae bacterium]
MLKSDLREAGYAEQEKYPKKSVITSIWVFSTFAMIVLAFVFVFLANAWKMAEGAFAVFVDEVTVWLNQSSIFQQLRFVAYLLLWALILLTLFFVTKLEKQTGPQKAQRRPAKYILRAVLALLTLAASFYFLTLLSEMADPYNYDMYGVSAAGLFEYIAFVLSLFAPSDFIEPIAIFIYLILLEFMYLAVKLAVTRFVCHDKESGIQLKVPQGTAIPTCACGEALSLRHILTAYLVPFVFIYSLLIASCAGTDSINKLVCYTVMAVFMSFFLAYDLTLVLYSVYLKLRYKPDYISINHHIYDVTLYKKSYVTRLTPKKRSIDRKK